ncbi:MAG: SDR family oxidoreductase [Nitrososphaeraceae archaeon]
MGKSVIVTGASSGIGKETVIKLLESGYQVFGLARRYDKLAVESARILNEIQSKRSGKELYIPIEFDITKPEIFNDVISKITSNAGDNAIYGLVNNAGYLEPAAIEDITMDNLRNQFETNFFGHVDITKRVLSIMMMQRSEIGGRIINISSLAGLISFPLIGAYAASKHALEAMSDALRMELWNTSIKVITINPGVINTSIYDTLRPKIDDILNKNNKTRFILAYNKYFPKSNYYTGLNPIAVANVIHKAISLPNPSQRYTIGSTKEKFAVRLLPLIPDRLFYSLVAKRIHSK